MDNYLADFEDYLKKVKGASSNGIEMCREIYKLKTGA